MGAPVVTQLIVDASGARLGVEAFVAAMEKAKAAAVDGGTATATSFESAQRRWTAALGATDPVIRAQIKMQDDLAKQTLIGNKAVELGITTQAAAAAQLAKVTQKHEENILKIKEHTGQLTLGQRAMLSFGEATKGVSGNLIAMAEGLGPVGTAIAGLGGGFTVAAVLIGGAIELAKKLAESAIQMGEFARMLKESAETMGVTTDQLQGLNLIAASVGVGTEKNTLAFERFTVQLNQLRQGTGTLFTELHKVAPELLTQLAATREVTSAIDLLAQSYVRATDQAQKNAIARAAFGRAGFEEGRVLAAIHEAGGLEAYTAGLNKADVLTKEQIDHWGLLSVEIEHATNLANKNFASIFTGPALAAEKRFADSYLDFSREVKNFTLNGDWHKFIADISSEKFLAYLAAIGAGAAAGGIAGGKLGAMSGNGLVTFGAAVSGAAVGGGAGFLGMDVALNTTVDKLKNFAGSLVDADTSATLFGLKAAHWAAFFATRIPAVGAAVPLAADIFGFPMAMIGTAIMGLYAYTHSHDPMTGGEITRQQRGGRTVRGNIRESFQTDDPSESTAQSEFRKSVEAQKLAADQLANAASQLKIAGMTLDGVGKAVAGSGAPNSLPGGDESPLTVAGIGTRIGTAEMTKPAFQANMMKIWTSAMGDALTVEERFIQKAKDLAAAYDEGTLGAKNALTGEAELRRDRILSMDELDKVIALETLRNSMLGAATPVFDIVKQKTDELAKKQKQLQGSGQELTDSEMSNATRLIRAQTDGTFALQANINATNVQTKSLGLSIGAADTFSIVQTKINENLNVGLPRLSGISDGFLKLATAAGVAKQAQAELKAQNDATFARQTVFLDATEQQIAVLQRSLHGNDWKDFMNDGLSATLRVNAALKDINTAAGDFSSGFLKDMAHGVAPMDALANGAKRLADNLIDAAGKKLSSLAVGSLADVLGLGAQTSASTAGATSAATILTSAGANVAASMIAGATAAAKILGLTIPEAASSLPAAGGLTATEVTTGGAAGGAALQAGGIAAGLAASGPFIAITAAIIAAAAIAESLIGKAKKEREDALALQKNNAAALQLDQSLGGNALGSGSITQNMTQMNLQVQSALAAFHGQVTAAGLQLFADAQAFFARTVKDFQENWGSILAQLGDNSEFDTARSNVAKFAQTIQDFVNNTRDLGSASQLAQAQSAGQKALLATLQAAPQLSATATEFQRIMGTAAGLTSALETLGLSSADAAKAISSGVTSALNDLSKNFAASLTARLNVANGKSYINDIITTLQNHASDIADALRLGDPALATLADSVFSAEAQKIVDDTGLVGDAFTSLTNQFPDLVGVVHEATQAVKDQAAAQTDLNNAAKGVTDYLNGLLSGSGSTLSPQAILANAQSAYNANLNLAQGGNLDAVNKFPELAENLRKAAEAMFGSSSGYQGILSQIINQGLGLPAVQQATDPVVQAMRDVLTAVTTQTATLGTAIGTLLTQAQLQASGLAANSTVANLLTAAQLVQAGLATNTTVGSLLTAPELQASGLAANTTVANLLTAAQLAQTSLTGTGLATQQTVFDGVIQGNQDANNVKAAVNTANVTIGSLLTKAELDSLGLAANVTVGQLLTANQLAQTNLTNTGLASNQTVGSLLTSTQLASLGLAANATVGGLLTAAQLAQTNLSNTGLLTQTQTLALGLATDASTAGVIANTGATANNAAATANNVATSNAVLTAIQGLQNTAAQQLQLLNTQYSTHTITITAQQGVGVNQQFNLTNTIADALQKIVFNTYATSVNTFALVSTFSSASASLPHNVGIFASGGVIPPYGLGLVSEHSPGGGRFVRAGSESITVSPYAPSNDNSSLAAELRELRKQVADLQKELRYNSNLTAAHIDVDRSGHAQTVASVEGQTQTIKAEARQDRNNPRKVA